MGIVTTRKGVYPCSPYLITGLISADYLAEYLDLHPDSLVRAFVVSKLRLLLAPGNNKKGIFSQGFLTTAQLLIIYRYCKSMFCEFIFKII